MPISMPSIANQPRWIRRIRSYPQVSISCDHHPNHPGACLVGTTVQSIDGAIQWQLNKGAGGIFEMDFIRVKSAIVPRSYWQKLHSGKGDKLRLVLIFPKTICIGGLTRFTLQEQKLKDSLVGVDPTICTGGITKL
jgi:hypothetical protein